MRVTKFSILIVIVALTVVAIAFFLPEEKKTNPIEAEFPSLFQITGLQTYQLHYQQKSINFGLSNSRYEVDMTANLDIQVDEITEGIVKTRFQLRDIQLISQPENKGLDQALTDYYARVVKVNFEPNGRMASIEFPGLDENYVGYRQMLLQMEMVLQQKPNYQLQQTDALGSYQSTYQKQNQELRRLKRHYQQNANEVVVFRSKAEAELSKDENWFQTFNLIEKIQIKQDGKKVLQNDTDIVLQRITASKEKVAAFKTIEEDQNLFQTLEEKQTKLYFQQQVIDLGKLIKKVTAMPESIVAFDELQTYLSLYPDQITQLRTVIENGSSALARNSIAILDAMQHEQAQQFLAGLVADTQLPAMNRTRAVIALSGQKKPSIEVIDTLKAVNLDRNSEDANDLANTALLALGNLAKGQDEVKSSILPVIQNALMDATNYNNAKAALLAAKNAGTKDLIDDILPYLNSDNLKLRKLAFSLLELESNHPNVQVAIQQRSEVETDKDLKKQMINALP